MKHTNKDTLAKGVKYLAGALPLIFIGPSIFILVPSTIKTKLYTGQF